MKPHLRISIQTLLDRGATQREIQRFTGVDRKTIRRYQRVSNSPGVATGSEVAGGQIPPPRPPAPQGAAGCEATRLTPSACEPYRTWIEVQVGLGRNAVSIYQDLVEAHGLWRASAPGGDAIASAAAMGRVLARLPVVRATGTRSVLGSAPARQSRRHLLATHP